MQAPVIRQDPISTSFRSSANRNSPPLQGFALGSLIRDLDGQLSGLGERLRRELAERQALRGELDGLYQQQAELPEGSPEAGPLADAIADRESRLSELNSNPEFTAVQIQSLSDQRKSALNLLSNLIAACGELAKAIIANVRP